MLAAASYSGLPRRSPHRASWSASTPRCSRGVSRLTCCVASRARSARTRRAALAAAWDRPRGGERCATRVLSSYHSVRDRPGEGEVPQWLEQVEQAGRVRLRGRRALAEQGQTVSVRDAQVTTDPGAVVGAAGEARRLLPSSTSPTRTRPASGPTGSRRPPTAKSRSGPSSSSADRAPARPHRAVGADRHPGSRPSSAGGVTARCVAAHPRTRGGRRRRAVRRSLRAGVGGAASRPRRTSASVAREQHGRRPRGGGRHGARARPRGAGSPRGGSTDSRGARTRRHTSRAVRRLVG